GVHRGHQALLRHLRESAAARGLASGVITFHPAPIAVFRPDVRVMYITSLEERIELLQASGVDAVAPVTFTSELAQVSAEDFVAAMCRTFDMRLLLGGPDISVGRARQGDATWLAEHGPALGFELEVVQPVMVEGDHKVGSSGIRDAVARGDMETAAEL